MMIFRMQLKSWRAIKKLDKEARAQFLSTFELVQKNFIEMFTTLFEGGEAHLSLGKCGSPGGSNSYKCSSAGKKMRGVQLLSGGERALTAISLLFSLPCQTFCLLYTR